jgi:hypothetical protein
MEKVVRKNLAGFNKALKNHFFTVAASFDA